MLACLVILTMTFFVLTVYSILQANIALLPTEFARFLAFKLLDTSSAATLFVTLVGALLVRHQFAIGLLPHVNYRSAVATMSDPYNPAAVFETWRVVIRNSGLGAAIMSKTDYVLELSGEQSVSFSGTHQEIVSELAKVNLFLEKDYWLANNTPGFALSPQDDCLVFEIRTEHLSKIQQLDMMLYFQSQLGGKYWQKIAFIPHHSRKAEQQAD